MAVKESHRLKIEDRVFTKADVIKIGEVLLTVYGTLGGDDTWQSFTLKVECDDDTAHEGDDLSLLYDGDIFERKRVTTIYMRVNNRKPKREINIWLREGRFASSSLEVGGDDQQWVRGTFFTLEDVIKSVKHQDNTFIRNPFFQWFTVSLTAFLLIEVMTHTFISQSVTGTGIFTSILLVIIYCAVAYWLFWQMESAWPRVEFAFGPDHRRAELRRRKWLAFLSMLIILPLLTSLIYDLIKSLIA
jgi:hypothetical protein